MNPSMNAQASVSKNEAKEQLKLQLADYLEHQPESTRTLHRWMKLLEWASFGIAAIVFIIAMVLSISWASLPRTEIIPAAWFALPGSLSLTALLIGLHALILKAYPPVLWLGSAAWRASSPAALLGKNSAFVTGGEAIGRGWIFIIGGILLGAFWGLFAYASWTANWTLLAPLINILGVAMGIGIAASILYAMYQKLFKSR